MIVLVCLDPASDDLKKVVSNWKVHRSLTALTYVIRAKLLHDSEEQLSISRLWKALNISRIPGARRLIS